MTHRVLKARMNYCINQNLHQKITSQPLTSDIYRPIQTQMPETYHLLCSLEEHSSYASLLPFSPRDSRTAGRHLRLYLP